MDRWVVEKSFEFQAAHRLPHHDGKCAQLHGHSWKGVLAVTGNRLGQRGAKSGMVVDFGELKAVIRPMFDIIDHSYLNESIPELESPTSEELSRWMYLRANEIIAGRWPGVRLLWVRIEETCTSACTYSKEADEDAA